MSSIKSATIRSLRSKPLARSSTRISTTAERNVGIVTSSRTLNKPHFDLSPTYYSPKPQIIAPPPSTFIYKSQNPFQDLMNSITTTLTQSPSTSRSPILPTLHNLLRSYTSNPEHWSKFAHGSASQKYTRNLVCEVPGLFNLLLLVWTPGKESPVHDHADSHCLMKVLKGTITETRFAIPSRPGEGPLHQTSKKNFGRDSVTYMSDALGLHEVSNPSSTEYAVSLHLYTPPNAALRGCHVYDLENGEAKHVIQGAYHSVDGILAGN